MKSLLIALVATLIGGCAIYQTPYLTYSDRNTPLKNTAVLVAWDNGAPGTTGADIIGVLEVDGESLDCFNGCPFWVRVLPGTHTFKIRYQSNTHLTGPGVTINSQVALLELKVEEMKPGHTYLVRYGRNDGQVTTYPEDIGLNANFGMPICGMYGDCKTLYRAKFE